MTHEELYSRLRADILARHYSLNRYARADHFDLQSFLGTQIRAGDHEHNASPGGITWTIPKGPVGRLGQIAPLYRDAADLRERLSRRRASQLERWRWAKHDRTNALLQTGFRLVSLCVDARAGDELAWQVVERTLNTLHALLRFKHGPEMYRGYIVRWDVVASDLWEVKGKALGGATAKPPKLIQNHEFLLNPDTKTFGGGDHYLYCTPLNDPRHRQAIRDHEGAQRGGDRYRRWEPSLDEYVGLVLGYFMIWHTFGDHSGGVRDQMSPAGRSRADSIIETVRQHVRWIGKYLKETGYYLVRPCGGFACRGALDMNPVFEYPFARVFSRITGDSMETYLPTRDATFERAVELAGHGAEYRDFGVGPVYVGHTLEEILVEAEKWPADPAQQKIMRAVLALPVLAGVLLAPKLIKAAAFHERLQLVGTRAEVVGSGVMNYLFNFVARNYGNSVGEGSKKLFETVFPLLQTNGSSTEFAPLLGLTSLDDGDDPTVRTAFMAWYRGLRDRGDIDPTAEIEPGDVRVGMTVTANAVRFLLAPDAGRAAELGAQLDAMNGMLATAHNNRPPIGAYGQPGAPEPAVAENQDSARIMFGYLAPLSIAWLHQLRGGSPPIPNLPPPSQTSTRAWPVPEVPRAVIEAAFPFPRHAIQRTPLDPSHASYALFKDPPSRPRDEDLGPPAAPVSLPGAEIAIGPINDGWPVPESLVEIRRPLPPVPSGVDAARYLPIAVMDVHEDNRVEFSEAFTTESEVVVRVQFRPRRPTLIPPDADIGDNRRFRATVVVSWTRHTD